MYVVVVEHKDGKIELTKDELQKMLDEAYAKGKEDERNSHWYTLTCGDTWKPPYTYSSTTYTTDAVSVDKTNV